MHSDDLPDSESFHFRLMFFLDGYIDRIVPGGTDSDGTPLAVAWF